MYFDDQKCSVVLKEALNPQEIVSYQNLSNFFCQTVKLLLLTFDFMIPQHNNNSIFEAIPVFSSFSCSKLFFLSKKPLIQETLNITNHVNSDDS